MSFNRLKYEPTSPEVMKRWFVPLTASLVILFGGLAWTWQVGKESNAIDHHLSHLRDAVGDLRSYVKLNEETAQQ